MSKFHRFLCVGAASIALASAALAQVSATVPPHGKLVALFNGKDFHGFDTLLEKHGINNDPERVFQVEKGMLHISGQEFGGLVTQSEYGNYYLRAEFKWGEKIIRRAWGKLGTAVFNTTLPARSRCGRG